MATKDWPTPNNAIAGRQVSIQEFKELRSKAHKSMLRWFHIEDVSLGQTKKQESGNYGRWFFTWGSAFLGFYGAISKEQLQRAWVMKKLRPFPTEKEERHQFGIGRVSMAQLLEQADEGDEEPMEFTKPVKRKLDFDEEEGETKPPPKRKQRVAADAPVEESELHSDFYPVLSGNEYGTGYEISAVYHGSKKIQTKKDENGRFTIKPNGDMQMAAERSSNAHWNPPRASKRCDEYGNCEMLLVINNPNTEDDGDF